MAGALNDLGVKAKTWMNWQIPILTEGDHSNARIVNINVKDINNYLSEGGLQLFLAFKVFQKQEILLQLVEVVQMLQQL